MRSGSLAGSMSRPNAPDPTRSRKATLALLVVTVLWGFTFVWMKQGLDAAEKHLGAAGSVAGIGLFMSLRFGLAAVLAWFMPSARRGLNGGVWMGGLWIGGLLLAGFLLQMFGLQGVSAPVSAFLTSLYVVFTALLVVRRPGHRMGVSLIVGALLATFGAGFIQGPPQLSFGLAEWLTVGCAFVFAVHILATEYVTSRHAPMPITLATFCWVTLGSLATLAVGMQGDGPGVEALVELALDPEFAKPMLLSSVLATSLALSLMNTWQRELEPVRAAILYAVEPVWATLVAIGLGQAEAGLWLAVGGGSLLLGNLIAELGPLLASRRAH